MLRIYGASDDLVEVEGFSVKGEPEADAPILGRVNRAAANDEIGCYDSTVQLVIGDDNGGAVVTMDYGEPGVWSALIHQLGEDVPIPWAVRIVPPEGPRHKTWGYSVCVEIDAPDGTPVRITVEKRRAEVDLCERVTLLEARTKFLETRNRELEQLEASVKKAMKSATPEPFVAVKASPWAKPAPTPIPTGGKPGGRP